MTRRQSTPWALVLAFAAVACAPKADTAPPDGGGAAVCAQDVQTCEDGTTVSREGPDCAFPACPGEALESDADADPEADADADADADAEDAEPATDEADAE